MIILVIAVLTVLIATAVVVTAVSTGGVVMALCRKLTQLKQRYTSAYQQLSKVRQY
jgi:hypothetical protein